MKGLTDQPDTPHCVHQISLCFSESRCVQAAAKRKEAERLAAEKSKLEERDRRKQRLDAGFAEVCII